MKRAVWILLLGVVLSTSVRPDISQASAGVKWTFIGDSKTSPVKGVKFQSQGYTCKVKRLSIDGKLTGEEIEIRSDKQATVGSMLKKAEQALKLPRTYDESLGNIKNIGTSMPVYQVISKNRNNDYLAACAIWVSGRLLYAVK